VGRQQYAYSCQLVSRIFMDIYIRVTDVFMNIYIYIYIHICISYTCASICAFAVTHRTSFYVRCVRVHVRVRVRVRGGVCVWQNGRGLQ